MSQPLPPGELETIGSSEVTTASIMCNFCPLQAKQAMFSVAINKEDIDYQTSKVNGIAL